MRKREVITVSVSKVFKDFMEAKSKETGIPLGRLIENYAGFKFLQDELITNLFYSSKVPIEQILSVWSRVMPHVVSLTPDGKVKFAEKEYRINELPTTEQDLKNLLYEAIYERKAVEETANIDELLKHYLLHLVKVGDNFELIPEKGSPIREILKVNEPSLNEVMEAIENYLSEQNEKAMKRVKTKGLS